MTAALAHAQGAPCPTAVLDGRTLPETEPELLAALAELRAGLTERGAGGVLKNAIVAPSRHPLFDLDYRFVQSLPQRVDSFDVRGSCGHSILAAVEAAARTGMIQPLVPGCRVRVNVLNNGDNVVCETEQTSEGGTRFTAHFLCSPPRPLTDLLLTGEAVTRVPFEGRDVTVSLVSMGNPYILVPAHALGAATEQELFTAGEDLFDTMRRLRRAVCEVRGWDPSGAFPKIAALLPGASGGLAVRAVSVPSWHPTVALTGAICLGAAAGIEGTVAHQLALRSGHRHGLLRLRTPGGVVQVAASRAAPPQAAYAGAVAGTNGTNGAARTAAADGTAPGPAALAWVSVGGKRVDYRGRLAWARAQAPSGTVTEPPEEHACLPLTV
ncbi:PrpF domain-containing protein [Streptomyces sp. JJ36]|uniref:PrpF domain-containing protein n=1 Tax=Streptomyces sp. JJ36 TaxID=2736645 RepID=UPI001F1ADDDE|nr:PrpF domain-containing protein [Streptomyces sp. JJ36]MCF6524774.1 hypothetical protein [Streptomyces sp. JJ36]